jgi:hypothetical protein
LLALVSIFLSVISYILVQIPSRVMLYSLSNCFVSSSTTWE